MPKTNRDYLVSYVQNLLRLCKSTGLIGTTVMNHGRIILRQCAARTEVVEEMAKYYEWLLQEEGKIPAECIADDVIRRACVDGILSHSLQTPTSNVNRPRRRTRASHSSATKSTRHPKDTALQVLKQIAYANTGYGNSLGLKGSVLVCMRERLNSMIHPASTDPSVDVNDVEFKVINKIRRKKDPHNYAVRFDKTLYIWVCSKDHVCSVQKKSIPSDSDVVNKTDEHQVYTMHAHDSKHKRRGGSDTSRRSE